MAAYSGGCLGPGSVATFCVCDCHIDGGTCDQKTCVDNGKGRVRSFFTSDSTPESRETPRDFASDHVRLHKPNRTARKPEPKRHQRALRSR